MKRILSLAVILMLLQVGCGTQTKLDILSQKACCTSSTSSEDCFLCNAEKQKTHWLKHNIGIISLNTFEVIPIEIIRDEFNGSSNDMESVFITQLSKTTSDGFQASRTIFPDRAYAHSSVYLYSDETWDIENTASFLCQDCLNQLTENVSGYEFGVGILDLNAAKIHVFERQVTGFCSGDFYVHWDITEKSKYVDTTKLELLVFYCPQRLNEES